MTTSRQGRAAWFRIGVLVALACVMTASPCLAQVSTGTILGVVKDSSGAVVAGASVTVLNANTGLSRSVMTADDGSYRFPALPSGSYELRVVQNGFQTEERKGITLTVAQDANVDIALTVGSTVQSVVVNAEAPQVNVTSSTVGSLINEQKVQDLPLNGRNFTDLALMQPGITQARSVGNLAGLVGTFFSSNGAPLRSNNYMLDGAVMQSLYGLNNSSMIGTSLGVDGIREFRVVTSLFSAEYGLTMGSQTVIVSKGGTNSFHGDVFEYLRNSAMDARNFFDAVDTTNALGFGSDKSAVYPGKRLPPFQRNNFGASVGGPIRKDKTFFFATYEGLRQRLGSTIALKTLPASCFNSTTHVALTVVPSSCATGAPAGTTFPLTVSPVTYPVMALYPYPNITGQATFNYSFPYIEPTKENYGQIRVDHIFSDADSIFVRYTRDVANRISAQSFDMFRSTYDSDSTLATISESHIFAPTVLNSARLSFSRTTPRNDSFTVPTAAHPSSTYPTYVQTLSGQPQIDLGGNAAGSGTSALQPNTVIGYGIQNVISLSEDVFWTKGKHAMKFGVLFNHFQDALNARFEDKGVLNFNSLFNFFKGSYSELVWLPATGSQNRLYHYETAGFYAQDDFRALSRLTLNLGLRYEFNTIPVECCGRQFFIRDMLTAQPPNFSTPGPIMTNPSLKSFSPRVGFAWDVTGKGTTSVRGGFGVYYDIGVLGSLLFGDTLATPPISSFTRITNVFATPTCPLQLPLDGMAACGGGIPPNFTTIDYEQKQPRLLQYSLTGDQQLPWAMTLTLGYVGSRGYNLPVLIERNPTVPVGISNGLPFYCNLATDPTCNTQQPKANPAIGITTVTAAVGQSWYNGLQANLTKRLTSGLQLQFGYTWSKALDTGQGQISADGTGITQSPGNPNNIDKGPSVFDVRHNVRFNLIYRVPNIKSDRLVAKPLQGWSFATIVAAQTGAPLTPILGFDRALQNNQQASKSTRPNIGSSFNKDTVIKGTPNQWFDPTMFALQPAGTLGNASRGLLTGPGLQNVDISFWKDTRAKFLGEGGAIQIRGDFFNVMNHPNFGNPVATVYTASAANANPLGGQIGSTAFAPFPTAGQISTTSTDARKVQLSLKILF
jgi:hypothetical protein